jgi:hypothetical protein
LGLIEAIFFHSILLSDAFIQHSGTLSIPDTDPTAKIRNAEIRSPIATISGADKRKQGLVLADRHVLAHA